MSQAKSEQYRLQNLSCANCAAKFERNVRDIDAVEDVQLNFGAAKLTVVGAATIEQLEAAGAFDGIKVTSATKRHVQKKVPFYKQQENQLAFASLLFVVCALIVENAWGAENRWPTILYAIAIVVGGFPIFKTGFSNLIKFEFDMKTLITIAIIGAAVIGEWQEAAIVVFLFAVSEALEAYSMSKARRSIEQLMDIAPPVALVKRAHGNHHHEVEVPTEELVIGDILIVKPGQKIAMDGEIISGLSTVNQAAITGESVPVTKTIGDEVFAGTLNGEGSFEVRVTKHVADTTIAKIIHLVEEAQAEKAPSQQFVDRFAKYYTPVIMLVALLVALIPGFVTGDWQHWVYQGLAVLVVGCPCALVISTPVAIVTAIGNAASQGVLIKGGVYLEQLAHIKAVAFDKTGTLTKGQPEVTQIHAYTMTEQELLAVVAAVEKKSQHPLARAIAAKAFELGVTVPSVTNFQSVTGKGAHADVFGETIYVGSARWIATFTPLSQQLKQTVDELAMLGQSVIMATNKKDILGILAIADQLREESSAVIEALHKQQIEHTVMLTGDAQPTAEAIAAKLALSDVRAGLLPENKLQTIKELQQQYGHVAMVGDGINDAPALATATVGIAMGGAGTDAALETAHIALMSDDLTKLPYTIRLSQKTLQIIKQNILFALSLKLIALLLVVPGWLTLWIAIFADMGATLLVVLNSLRLLKLGVRQK
ncbi:MAG: heavy metal translocating P-type ATPase [Solibacillus sp.]